MKRNSTLGIAAVLLVVLGGVGLIVGYKGYKKYKSKQNQEFRFEGTMGQARDGFDKKIFKKEVLSDALLDQVIEKHQLIDVWGTGDSSTARAKIREKFHVKLEGMTVKASFQDKDKALAQSILQSIVLGYHAKFTSSRRRVPSSSSAPAPAKAQ